MAFTSQNTVGLTNGPHSAPTNPEDLWFQCNIEGVRKLDPVHLMGDPSELLHKHYFLLNLTATEE